MKIKLRRFYWRIMTWIYGDLWLPKGSAFASRINAGTTLTEMDFEFMAWKIQTGQWSIK